MGKILDFLFGREPEIFNNLGKVQHKLAKSRWDAWENRFKSNPIYNWRLHTGTLAGAEKSKKKSLS